MKALLLSKYGQLQLTQMLDPSPAPDEVLLRVASCGICGSDVHGYDGSSGRRIPPIVMGHEAAGTIAAVGSEVTKWHAGDRVTFDSTLFCGHCGPCLRGDVNLCDQRQVFGVSCADYRRNGAFAEYIAVPQRVLYKLPDTLDFAEAALIEAVSVALHAISLAQVQPGSSALVVGAGMIGTLIVQGLRVRGCSEILVADPDASRLRMATDAGATHTFATTDAAGAVLEHTRGAGVDVVFEAVGNTVSVNAAIGSVRKGGTVALVGNIAPRVEIPLQAVVTRQLRLQGCCASAGEYAEAIKLMASGEIRVEPLITAVAPLSDGAEWFRRLHAREPNLMKVVLTPEPA